MGAESASGRHAILIDDAEAAETHVRGIVVIGEGEGVIAVEPAVLGMAPLVAFAEGKHGVPFSQAFDARLLQALRACFRRPAQLDSGARPYSSLGNGYRQALRFTTARVEHDKN